MRVTNGMIMNNSLNALFKNSANLNKLYAQMSTGKKIQTVSDNPIIAGKSLKLQATLLNVEQFTSNASDATSWMQVTESALDNMNSIVTTIREKVVYAANGTLTDEDRRTLLSDMQGLYEQLKQEVNTSYNGRYIFSGYKTGEPLILTEDLELEKDLTVASNSSMTLVSGTTLAAGSKLAKGTTISVEDAKKLGLTPTNDKGYYTLETEVSINTAYTLEDGVTLAEESIVADGSKLPAGSLNPAVHDQIDGQNMQYEIGTNSTITVNTLGMDDTMSNLMGLMEEMIAIVEKAQTDDTYTSEYLNKMFNEKLTEIDAVQSDILDKTSQVGTRVSRLDYIKERLLDEKTTYTELLSDTEDIDVESVYVEFMSQYATYQSALQATSKVITNTLADYL